MEFRIEEIGPKVIECTKKLNSLNAYPWWTERMRKQHLRLAFLSTQNPVVRRSKQQPYRAQHFLSHPSAFDPIRSSTTSPDQGHQEMKMTTLVNPTVFFGKEF